MEIVLSLGDAASPADVRALQTMLTSDDLTVASSLALPPQKGVVDALYQLFVAVDRGLDPVNDILTAVTAAVAIWRSKNPSRSVMEIRVIGDDGATLKVLVPEATVSDDHVGSTVQ